MLIKTCTEQKLRKITNRFCEIRKFEMQHMKPVLEKEQKFIQGPGILKVRARRCRVTVLYTFSQETGVLLFYVKPLVRNFYYFYVSDYRNAVYCNTYHTVTICANQPLP